MDYRFEEESLDYIPLAYSTISRMPYEIITV